MFGNERGGEAAIAFGFKDRNNGTAQSEYYNEVREVIELVNVGVAQALVKDLGAADARSLVREIQDTGETMKGVKPEDLLFIPDPKFYRQRGMEDVVFMPFDVCGNLIAENEYLGYLRANLPEHYLTTNEFRKYEEAFLGRERPTPGASYGW